MRGKRVVERHEAASDLAERWPGWKVHETVDLPDGVSERFLVSSKAILIDSSDCGRDWALAHVTAHLDLDHHLSLTDGFSPTQESEANWLAEVRMDYDLESVPLDGDPSIHL